MHVVEALAAVASGWQSSSGMERVDGGSGKILNFHRFPSSLKQGVGARRPNVFLQNKFGQ